MTRRAHPAIRREDEW